MLYFVCRFFKGSHIIENFRYWSLAFLGTRILSIDALLLQLLKMCEKVHHVYFQPQTKNFLLWFYRAIMKLSGKSKNLRIGLNFSHYCTSAQRCFLKRITINRGIKNCHLWQQDTKTKANTLDLSNNSTHALFPLRAVTRYSSSSFLKNQTFNRSVNIVYRC